MPDGKELAFLHRPLRQQPPAETELWRVGAIGSSFEEIGKLSADFDWTLTKNHSGGWILLEGQKDGAKPKLLLSDGAETLKELKVGDAWQSLPSQGDGIFYQSVDEAMPFDQFVDMEDAPDMKPELGEPVSGDFPGASDEDASVLTPPTHPGIRIAAFNPETDELDQVLSIPYSRPEDRPTVTLVRRSPDQRFLALIVSFGESGSPGLWVYDSQNESLLWTRMVVEGAAKGIAWSSDSSGVAVSDARGLSILDNALGIESVRLELDLESNIGLLPMWGAGRKLFLVNEKVIYKVEQERGVAEPAFDSPTAGDMVFEPVSESVAFSSSPLGYRELTIQDLASGQILSKVVYPGSLKQKAQDSLAYKVGSAIRYAWIRWVGRG